MKSFRRFLTRYPLDPLGKSPRHRRILLAVTCAALLCAALCLGTLCLLYGSLYFVPERLFSYFRFPMLVFLNLLPVVVLVFFLFVLTNRAWLSFLLSAALLLAGSFANYYKVILRDEYAVFEDLKLLGAAAGIAGEYEFILHRWFVIGIVASLLGTVFLFLCCRGRLPGWRWRLGGAALLAALCVGSYFLWYASDTRYNTFRNDTCFNLWRPVESAASRGLVYTFIHSIEDVRQPAPPGYSKKAARAMLEAYPEAEIPAEEKVDVIAVMLESFSDFSELAGMPLAEDPYAPLRPIWAESRKGTLIVDTMGGGTINAERSFLTGYDYPHPGYRQDTESFARYFLRQGYATEGAHPGHDWFYNRQNVDLSLGLEATYFKENYFDQYTDREYAPDDVFFPQVAALYRARDRSKPYFAFHVSYQNHSPYDSDRLHWDREFVTDPALDAAGRNTVNNYLGGVADTAAQVAAFTEEMRQEPRPVVLVFFGDHKPTLGASNCYYDQLGVNLQQSDLTEGFRNYYSTPYWIWMNDAAKAALGADPAGPGPDISPCYLMREVFDACGWAGSPYLQFLSEARDALPVIQGTGVYGEDGRFTREISENSQILLEKLQQMQYYLRRTNYK